MTSRDVLRALSELFLQHGVPVYMRSDNGLEFVAKAIRDWLSNLGARTLYVGPGSPWEDGSAGFIS